MGKCKARNRQCKRAINERWKNADKFARARRLAFAIVVEGGRPEQVLNIFRWCGIPVPPMSYVYREMRTVSRRIVKMAQDSMRFERENLPPNTIIGFDGSWSHRRRGKSCFFSVVSIQTGKVIQSTLVSKSPSSDSQIACENSTLMESVGLQRAVEVLHNNPNITGYVHDNDGKARAIIRRAGWDIQEYLDPGHCKKSFERKMQNFEKKNGNILRAIETHLTRWMWTLVSSCFSVQYKVLLWSNTVNHMRGIHVYCLPHPPVGVVWYPSLHPQVAATLKKFLDKTQFIIEKCQRGVSTQLNESLNRKKLKYATKDVRWGASYEARMMCAILSRNVPDWKRKLYDSLNLDPLDPETEDFIQQREFQYYKRSILVKTDSYRKRRAQLRAEIRNYGLPIPAQLQGLAYRRNPYIRQ